VERVLYFSGYLNEDRLIVPIFSAGEICGKPDFLKTSNQIN